jgi:hypothetical protein
VIGLVAHRLGEEGFVTFAKGLHRLGVVDHGELVSLLAFHGALLRLAEPLDGGERRDEEALAVLEHIDEDVLEETRELERQHREELLAEVAET